jgi:hypothetical protein
MTHSVLQPPGTQSVRRALPRQLYLAWVPFQRRAVAMEADFGYDLHHIGVSFRSRSLRPLEYLLKAWQTLALLWRSRPQVLWIQMPPAPLLYLAFAYQRLFQPDLKIIADCHNATFRRPWIQFPGVIGLFNRCESVIVHNPFVEAQAQALGLEASRVRVLRDRTLTPALATPSSAVPAPAAPVPAVAEFVTYPRPWVLVPCSFNTDEPIAELFQAARLAPDLTFVVTGNIRRALGRHCLEDVPKNIRLAGFVSEAAFNALLAGADAIVGLTKLEGIQLSVANEALSYGQPMVLSNTKLLQAFFPQGAVYVDPLDGAAIAQGCYTAIRDAEALRCSVVALRQEVEAEWRSQAEPIFQLLESWAA